MNFTSMCVHWYLPYDTYEYIFEKNYEKINIFRVSYISCKIKFKKYKDSDECIFQNHLQ